MPLKTTAGDHGHAVKGRGATINIEGRFEVWNRESDDDGWFQDPGDEPARVKTVISIEHAKSVISRHNSPDVGFAQSINPYRGCAHGCVYCFARPTHAYLGLSPGLDFETRLTAKVNAAEKLREELAKPGYKCEPLTIGVNTDALGNGHRPPELRETDLLVSTPAYEPLVRRLSAQLEKPCIIADVRTDLIGGEWRLLLRKPVYVVVRDVQFRTALLAFFEGTKGKENLRVLVVDADDVSAIPAGAPTYVTRGARDWLRAAGREDDVGGRMLPNARTFSSSTAEELITFILKANLAALSTRA